MLSTDNKNFKILALAISALIVGVEAQANCTETSHQCCWVVRSWQLMNQSVPFVISSTDNSCCFRVMYGVTCDSRNTTILKINWPGHWSLKPLTGSIPAEIGNLNNLTELVLNSNQLSGSIPAWIGNLKSLTKLVLSQNPITGTFPSWIGNLVSLEVLELGMTGISGTIPKEIGNLINLKSLGLRSVLGGKIPPEIGNCTNLESIELMLAGYTEMPPEFGKLTKLQYLGTAHNPFIKEFPPEMGNLVNLRELVGGVGLGPWIGKLTKLETLIRVERVKYIPPEIGNCTKLRSIWIYPGGITSIPPEMENLKLLGSLNLAGHQISGTIPAFLGNMTSLRDLNLDNNQLSGPFTPNCNTKVYAANTLVTLCGCATSVTPAALFPPPDTPFSCLATSSTLSLTKRALVFSQSIGTDLFTCNTDTSGNPYQDCLNFQAAVCNPSYISGNAARIDNCKNSVDKMTRSLSSYWQTARKSCGQWSFDGIIGSPTSLDCTNANIALQRNAKYLVVIDGARTYISVTSKLTDSVIAGLWSQVK